MPLTLVFVFWTVAFFYLRYTKPTYDSTMLIQLGSNDSAKEVMEIEGLSKGDENMSAEVELLKSQLVFNRALKSLNYYTSVYSKGAVLTEELYKSSMFQVFPYQLNDSSLVDVPIIITVDDQNTIFLDYFKNGRKCGTKGKVNQHFKTADFDIVIKSRSVSDLKKTSEINQLTFVFNSINSLSAKLLPNLQVIPVNEAAKTIQLLYTGENTHICHDLILTVGKTFLIFDDELQRKSSENSIKFIDEQMAILAEKINNSKDSIMSIQSNTEYMTPESFETSMFSELSEFKGDLDKLEDEISDLQVVLSKIKSEPNRYEVYNLLPEILGKSYELLVSKKLTDLLQLLEQKENLLFNVTEEHSGVKMLNQKIKLKSQSLIKSINISSERLKNERSILSAKISVSQGRIQKLPEKKTEFIRLSRIQELNEEYYNLLTENKFKYSISDAGYSTNNQILSMPSVNEIPISPNRKIIYLSFIAIGLILGVGLLFLKYLTFNEINVLEDLNKLLPSKVTTLGGVPLVKNDMQYSQLLAFDFPKSQLAEAFRNIRTNLNYINSNYHYYRNYLINFWRRKNLCSFEFSWYSCNVRKENGCNRFRFKKTKNSFRI